MPSLTRAAVFAVLATFCFYAGSDHLRWPIWIRSSLVVTAIILATLAIAEGVNWLTENLSARVVELRRAQTLTPMLESLRVMASLSPQAQVELALHFGALGVEYGALIGNTGPTFYIPLRGYRVGYDFIDEFMQRSDERFLCPVRTWSEGSQERNQAVALTSFLIERGYAVPATGPQSATWKWFENGRVSGLYRARQALFGNVGNRGEVYEMSNLREGG